MAPQYLKLALNFPLLSLLFAGHLLQSVAGQASPAPTPCRGAAIIGDKIKDGYIFREGLSPTLDPGLALTLPYEGKKSSTWTNTSVIPLDCQIIADGTCSQANMEVYDALYFQTCTIPWTICRCLQSEMSQADTRDPFGMIGEKLRSYVRHVMAFPSPLDGWTYNQDIIFYGSAGSQTIVSNFIHQATHAMDGAIGNFSDQSAWKEAVDTDSCVADQAAAVSYSEAFAQAMVVHMYAILNNTFSVDTSCMSNQLDILQKLYPFDVLFPKSCDLSLKPPASRTVLKDSDDGITRPPASPDGTSGTNSTGISSAGIAGVVIGFFSLGILITFIAYVFWQRRRMTQAQAVSPKVEESNARGMTYPMPWATLSDENSVTTSSPPPRRQKDGQYYQTPPTRYEDSGGTYPSGQSTSVEGTARSPPSYLAATSYAGSG